jgi:feruloyl esterase
LSGVAARLTIIGAAALMAGPAHAAADEAIARCERLTTAGTPQLSIVSANSMPAGVVTAPDGRTIEVPASCRVAGVARPTADSEIGFELWLPAAWNGRYAQLGNGGFAGNIDHPSLASEIARGNAAAMTDTGHKASQFDASWALGHPEKVIDYGHRSIKVTADAAKALILAYYGRRAARRYFIGCSNGGRQALMAAQRYPDDWDGIIAGSPAVQWTRQLATFGAIQHRLRSDSANWIRAAKLGAIQHAAVATCGHRQLECRVQVRRLICRGRDTPACLTPSQAASLDMIQSDPLGFDPRFAAVPQNWEQWIVNPDRDTSSELMFVTSAFRFLVHAKPGWGIEQFDPRRDPELISNRMTAGQRLADILDADDPDLRGFQQHGGKLIVYVGTADALISPRGGIDYYRRLAKQMGGMERASRFARLFVVPGMQHCQGGPAPNAFGQAWVAPGLQPDTSHDIRHALESWVEQGRSPDFLVAAKRDGDRRDGRLISTRRLRPYPAAAGAVTIARP